MGHQKPTLPPRPPQDQHPKNRSQDFARQGKAELAKDRGNAGQSGNIRQNTHNQGYQQDR